MGFTRNSGNGSNFSEFEAKIVDIGLDYVEYQNGAQHRIIVVYAPLDGESRIGKQTNRLNTTKTLEVTGKERGIVVEGALSEYTIDIVGDVVLSGTIGGKAKVWLDQLEKLGYNMSDLEDTGDLKALLGLEGKWKLMTYSEAVGREPNKEYEEKKFWMPVELTKKPSIQKALINEVLDVVNGKSEDDMIEWSKETGMKMSDVFGEIQKAIDRGMVEKKGDVFEVKQN